MIHNEYSLAKVVIFVLAYCQETDLLLDVEKTDEVNQILNDALK